MLSAPTDPVAGSASAAAEGPLEPTPLQAATTVGAAAWLAIAAGLAARGAAREMSGAAAEECALEDAVDTAVSDDAPVMACGAVDVEEAVVAQEARSVMEEVVVGGGIEGGAMIGSREVAAGALVILLESFSRFREETSVPVLRGPLSQEAGAAEDAVVGVAAGREAGLLVLTAFSAGAAAGTLNFGSMCPLECRTAAATCVVAGRFRGD